MTTELIIVGVDVMVKGLTGVLIPLGFDAFVSSTQAMYLYNLIAISLLFFIAAFSGPRSEAAFCIIIPIFAGMFELFGWLRMPTAAQQSSLVVLTIITALLGVFIYMNDQNRQTYGTATGSKVVVVALFLMFFSGALTLTSGFSIFPAGDNQPVPGTCAAGFACDAFNNIDFSTSSGALAQNGGLGGSISTALNTIPGATVGAFILLLNILVGVFAFPVVLNGVMEGIWHGISGNALYVIFLGIMELVILVIYALGYYELLRGTPGGTV
jgi:hypothetical protein